MKLAFLTHEPFYPPSGGGSAEAIYLVEEWVRRGHQVHVFCPAVMDPHGVRDRFGVALHQFTAWPMGRATAWRNLKYLLYPFALQRMVEEAAMAVPFDLVFAQHSIAAVTAGRLKRRLGLPVAMNFLDYLTAFLETWPWYLAPGWLVKRLERFEVRLPSRQGADGILTVSDELADQFVREGYPRERVRPIYFGFDRRLFSRRKPAGPSTAGQGPVVAMHGSLDWHHLGRIAVETVAAVARQRPDARFRFVGPPTAARQRFEREVLRQVPGARIETIDFVPYAQVADHLADAAVGLVPYEESTGVHCAFVAKAVEYLALGIPTACTALRGLRRYFADEPLIRFAEFSGEALGAEVIRWLDEPAANRAAWGEAAAARMVRELDWEPIARRTADFVEAILAQAPPRGRAGSAAAGDAGRSGAGGS